MSITSVNKSLPWLNYYRGIVKDCSPFFYHCTLEPAVVKERLLIISIFLHLIWEYMLILTIIISPLN